MRKKPKNILEVGRLAAFKKICFLKSISYIQKKSIWKATILHQNIYMSKI